MNIITLISDYGNNSHYIAAIKGNILKNIPSIQIVDISHSIDKFNKIESAFVLSNSYKNFAEGSIHLICVDTNIFEYKNIVIAKHQNQYFIALDNGIINLIFDQEPAELWVVKKELLVNADLFIEKSVFVKVAEHLISNLPIREIAELGHLTYNLSLINTEIDEDGITANVAFIDGFGNIHFNLNKLVFEEVRNGRNFKIYYARKNYFDKISKHYNEVKSGAELVLFNSNNYLEIAINKGNASQLLGLKTNSKIIIEFL
ncbi:MAG: SAM hydrolase/SAM-dependent halogenase family protein [Bacteroidia bacterium]